jgi:hypothetical protein
LKSSTPAYENSSLGTQRHTPADLNPQHKTSLNFTETAKYFTALIAPLYKHKHKHNITRSTFCHARTLQHRKSGVT